MKNQKRIFITGTDTDVGKTLVATCLIEKLQKDNYSVIAVKPIAAGCEFIDGKLTNADARALIEVMNQKLAYDVVNPIALTAPIAPHIAAKKEGLTLSVESLKQQCNLSQHKSDYLLIEGAGGWLVPLNENETLADFAAEEQLDVLLVVGMKLGCISHALLTVQSIQSAGLNLLGWIANSTSTAMPYLKENILTLKQAINAPFFGEIPFIQLDNPSQTASSYVNIAPLK